MYANVVTTSFRTKADLEAASRELKSIVSEIRRIPGLRMYVLIRTGEQQVISLGVYESEHAARLALDGLTPLFAPIVSPRVDMPPHFGGGEVLASILNHG